MSMLKEVIRADVKTCNLVSLSIVIGIAWLYKSCMYWEKKGIWNLGRPH